MFGNAGQSTSSYIQSYSPTQGQLGQLAQQQMSAYNAAMMQNQQSMTKWMLDGRAYNSSQEFALALYPDDEQARLLFVLKYPT
jgi:hypothetical protein